MEPRTLVPMGVLYILSTGDITPEWVCLSRFRYKYRFWDEHGSQFFKMAKQFFDFDVHGFTFSRFWYYHDIFYVLGNTRAGLRSSAGKHIIQKNKQGCSCGCRSMYLWVTNQLLVFYLLLVYEYCDQITMILIVRYQMGKSYARCAQKGHHAESIYPAFNLVHATSSRQPTISI